MKELLFLLPTILFGSIGSTPNNIDNNVNQKTTIKKLSSDNSIYDFTILTNYYDTTSSSDDLVFHFDFKNLNGDVLNKSYNIKQLDKFSINSIKFDVPSSYDISDFYIYIPNVEDTISNYNYYLTITDYQSSYIYNLPNYIVKNQRSNNIHYYNNDEKFENFIHGGKKYYIYLTNYIERGYIDSDYLTEIVPVFDSQADYSSSDMKYNLNGRGSHANMYYKPTNLRFKFNLELSNFKWLYDSILKNKLKFCTILNSDNNYSVNNIIKTNFVFDSSCFETFFYDHGALNYFTTKSFNYNSRYIIGKNLDYFVKNSVIADTIGHYFAICITNGCYLYNNDLNNKIYVEDNPCNWKQVLLNPTKLERFKFINTLYQYNKDTKVNITLSISDSEGFLNTYTLDTESSKLNDDFITYNIDPFDINKIRGKVGVIIPKFTVLNSSLKQTSDKTLEVIDLPGLMFNVLTLPFAFITQAFNLNLFPNTAYAINFGDILLFISGILILMTIIKLILHLKG